MSQLKIWSVSFSCGIKEVRYSKFMWAVVRFCPQAIQVTLHISKTEILKNQIQKKRDKQKLNENSCVWSDNV